MLLDEIIELLSSKDGSLSEALLKTKVLLYQIGKKELIDWVNGELNGYVDENVPPYRIISCEVIANVANMAWQASAHPIPISHLDSDLRERFTTAVMGDSLAVIENALRNKKGSLIRNIPMEATGLLSKGLGNGFKVQRAWCELNMRQVENILVQVRSRLLDFVLELKDGMGANSKPEDMKQQAANIDTTTMFNNAIFGSNTTIVVGNNNKQTALIGFSKGDIAGLVETLTRIGVRNDDIDELKQAISKDEKERGGASFEGHTGTWYTKLMGRAARGALDVGVDVLSSTAAKAIAAFCGLPG